MDLKFLIPKKIVGLYFNQDFIEIAVIRKDIYNTKILKVDSRKIATQDVDVVDQNEIIRNAIDDLFVENKISRSNVVLNLPNQSVIVRVFSMPRLPEEEWGQAVRFEAQKYIPFRVDEIVADFIVLNKKDDSENMEVLFLCSKSVAISRYISILDELNISFFKINSVFLSMVKICLHGGIIDDSKPTLIMSVKKKLFSRERVRLWADMVLVYEGKPVVARDISVISSEDAIDEKFFNELFLSIKLFNSSLKSSKIEHVIFLEGGSLYKFEELFEENFFASVQKVDFQEMFNVHSIDGVSLGAAFSEIYWPDIDVNLFRDQSLKKSSPELKSFFIKGAFVSIFILIFLFVFQYFKFLKMDEVLQKKKREHNVLVIKDIDSLKKKRKKINMLERFCTQHDSKTILLHDFLKEISAIFDKDEKIWMDKVIYTIGNRMVSEMKIFGTAYTENAIEDVLLVNRYHKKIEEMRKGKNHLKYVYLYKTVRRDDPKRSLSYTSFEISISSLQKRQKR